MSRYIPEPEYVPSPWLDELSDKMADILVQSLHSLASACEDRYAQQLRRCWAGATATSPIRSVPGALPSSIPTVNQPTLTESVD